MEYLQTLGEWPVAAALRRSSVLYPLLNAAHIFSIGLLVGAVVALDLRMLGLFSRHPLPALAAPLVRVAAAGLALAVLTGALLFTVRPATYAENPAFLVKLGLVGLGIVNALVATLGRPWREALAGGPVTPGLRLSALLSIGLWAAAVVAGRWIGFLQ